MSYQNTTRSQDDLIRDAENNTAVNVLIGIIKDLDDQLSEWKKVSCCSDIPELEKKMAILDALP